MLLRGFAEAARGGGGFANVSAHDFLRVLIPDSGDQGVASSSFPWARSRR